MSTDVFVSNLTESDMYEIKAAQIAEQRSKDPEVKAFAALMVKDHTAMDSDMRPKIDAAAQQPATELDKRRSGFIDHLNSTSAADFDKTYIDQQVAAHQEALSLLQGYAQNGGDAGLNALAGTATPKVQAHLDRGQAIQSKLSASARAGGAYGQ